MDIKSLLDKIRTLSESKEPDFTPSLSKKEKSADFSTKPHEKRGRKVSGSRYGAQDDEDEDDEENDKKKKVEEPKVKRGRGRPKKNADSETGEVAKYDFAKDLQSFMIGNLPGGKLPGKPGKKHTLSDKDKDDNDTKKKSEKKKTKLKDWIEHVESTLLAEDAIPPGALAIPDISGRGQINPALLKIQGNDPTLQNVLNKAIKDKKLVSISPTTNTTNTTNAQSPSTSNNQQTISVSEEEVDEVAAPGQEDWIKKNKQRFIDQYGKNKGMSVLYATAWKRSKNKNESVQNTKKSVMEGYTLEDVLSRFPHEHKMCQEGWGMHDSLYEALCDHYFKEGRIPHEIWHGSLDDLRKHVEECYVEDTAPEMTEGLSGELAGGVLGRTAGTAIGGPIGGTIGGVVGSELGDRLQDEFTEDSDYLEEDDYELDDTLDYDVDDLDHDSFDDTLDYDVDDDELFDKEVDESLLSSPTFPSFPSPSVATGELADIKSKTPAFLRKHKNHDDWKFSMDDLRDSRKRTVSSPEGLAARTRELGLDEGVVLKEKWDTKMKTAEKDKGKWDGYSISELKAKKDKLMKKDKRTDSEQKEVKQIDFAIRAKQKKDKWGKIEK